MPRPANPKTPEGAAITTAITACGVTQAYLADQMDVTPGFISQFASGHRPIPWDKAELLAALLNTAPEQISVEYARLKEHFATSQAQRLDEAIVRTAIGIAKKATGLATGEKLVIDDAPEIFAQALRVAMASDKRKTGGVDGSGSGDGQAGAADRFARAAKDGHEAKPATGRRRKAG